MAITAMLGVKQLTLPKIISKLIGVAGFGLIATEHENKKQGEADYPKHIIPKSQIVNH
jgi:hypothetical protein